MWQSFLRPQQGGGWQPRPGLGSEAHVGLHAHRGFRRQAQMFRVNIILQEKKEFMAPTSRNQEFQVRNADKKKYWLLTEDALLNA